MNVLKLTVRSVRQYYLFFFSHVVVMTLNNNKNTSSVTPYINHLQHYIRLIHLLNTHTHTHTMREEVTLTESFHLLMFAPWRLKRTVVGGKISMIHIDEKNR